MKLFSCKERLETEEDCIEYLYAYKWPEGYLCPECTHDHAYKISTRRLPLYECAKCGHQASILKGTIMEGSRTDLKKWFSAIRLMSQDKISALKLSQAISVTYKTAWLMLHKIRRAMEQRHVRAYQISGIIDLNETNSNAASAESEQATHNGQARVVVGVSYDEEGKPFSARMKMIPELIQLTREDIERRLLSTIGLREQEPLATIISGPNADHGKWLHIIMSNVKSFIGGTCHARRKKHLQSYLDEYCYHINRAKNMRQFQQLLLGCTLTPKVTYRELVKL
jgi:transposase-like protein